jgi:hypothetical protein
LELLAMTEMLAHCLVLAVTKTFQKTPASVLFYVKAIIILAQCLAF